MTEQAAIVRQPLAITGSFQTLFSTVANISTVLTAFAIPLSVWATNLFIVLAVVSSILAGDWKNKLMAVKSNPVVLGALLLFVVNLISVSYSVGSWGNIFDGIHKYSKLCYIAFLVPIFLSNKKIATYAVNAFLSAIFFTFLVALLYWFGWITISKHVNGLGIFRNHIEIGALLAFSAYICASRMLLNQSYWRWFYLLLFAICAGAVLAVNTGRTGYVVFVALMLLLGWQWINFKGLLVAAVATLLSVAVIYVTVPHFKTRMMLLKNETSQYFHHGNQETSMGFRLTFAKKSFDLIKQRWLLGWGVGSYEDQFQHEYGNVPGFGTVKDPHNEYLLTLAQLGIFGFIALMALFFIQWRSSFSLPKEWRLLSQALVIGFMVGCLCDSFLILSTPGYFFVYFSALCFADSRRGIMSNRPLTDSASQ